MRRRGTDHGHVRRDAFFSRAAPQEIAEAIRTRVRSFDGFVVPAVEDWVAVIGKEFLYDDHDVVKVGQAVSRACRCPGIGLRVVRSDILSYWVFDKTGSLVDWSSPADMDHPTEQEAYGLMGRHERIAKVFDLNITPEEIRSCFEPPALFRDDAMHCLARRIGVCSFYEYSYNDLTRPDAAEHALEFADECIRLGGRSSRPFP